MNDHIIIGIHIESRERSAQQVQKLFTEYGEQIKTRLGLHDDVCTENGLILLEMNNTVQTNRMIEGLKMLEGINVQKMCFPH